MTDVDAANMQPSIADVLYKLFGDALCGATNQKLCSLDGRVVWSVCILSCRLGFDSESGQTNDFKIGIHSFPARRSALKGQSGEQAGKFTCCAVGKGT